MTRPQSIAIKRIVQIAGIIGAACLFLLGFLEVFAFSTPTENPITNAASATPFAVVEPTNGATAVNAQPIPTPLLKKWYSTQPLPAPLASAATVLVQSNNATYLYVIGGKNQAGKPVGDVWSTQVDPQNGGTLAAWQRQPSLSVPLYLHAAVAISNSIYVIGGWDGENWRAEIWRARLGITGTLQPWGHVDEVKNKEGGDKIKLTSHVAVGVTGATKKWLYVIGGENDNYEIQKAVYYAEIPTVGDTFAWKIAAPLPTRLYHMAAAVHDQTIYITGGLNEHNQAQAKVYFATVDADGQIGGWSNVAQNQPLYYHQAVIHQGHLVILGGRKDINTELKDVYSAEIMNARSLGSWVRQTSLPESRYRSSAVAGAADGIKFLYLLGGLHGEAYRDTIYYNDPPPDTPTPIPPTPTFTPTPTPSPTPKPGIAYLHLSNQPTGVIAPGERLTYTIRYGVIDYPDSSFVLTQVVITNHIPSAVEIVPDSLSPTEGVSVTSSGVTSDTMIIWTFLTPQPDGATNSVSYVVQQPISASLITNEGATITWQYRDSDGTIQDGRMISGAIYNPLTTLYLPIIADSQRE